MKNSSGWKSAVLLGMGVFAGATLLAAPTKAQDQNAVPPAPALRATARLVLADAVVMDKSGKALAGLGPQDFAVLEDGKRRRRRWFRSRIPPGSRPDCGAGRSNCRR